MAAKIIILTEESYQYTDMFPRSKILTLFFTLQDEMRLKQLRDTQVTSTRERWLDNLVSVLFGYTPHGGGEEEEEGAESQTGSQDDRQLVDDLEEELRQDRQNLIDRCKKCFLYLVA